MSVIDYIIINDILKINTEDRRVFRGCEIDSDHSLLGKNIGLLAIVNIVIILETKQYTSKLQDLYTFI